jgi:propanol-preferring alcohol dehydrogenase
MALQILAATTAVRVIAIDNDEEALIRAKALGAVHAFTSDESAVGKIRELVGPAPNGADVVLDFVCITPTLEIARKVVATGGNLTMVGLGAGELRMVPGVVADLPVPMETQVRIPFWGTKAELHEVLELGRTQKIQVRTEIYSIEQASEVYRKLAMREIRGRAVIVPQR